MNSESGREARQMNSESGREALDLFQRWNRAKREGPAATRRRPTPAAKRNAGDGPIPSPCAEAGSVRACVRTHS